LGKADQIRREMSDKDELPRIGEWFRVAARTRGWKDKDIDAVWHEVAAFADTGRVLVFNPATATDR